MKDFFFFSLKGKVYNSEPNPNRFSFHLHTTSDGELTAQKDSPLLRTKTSKLIKDTLLFAPNYPYPMEGGGLVGTVHGVEESGHD